MQTVYLNWGHRFPRIGPKFPAVTSRKGVMARRNKTAPKPTMPKLQFTNKD